MHLPPPPPEGNPLTTTPPTWTKPKPQQIPSFGEPGSRPIIKLASEAKHITTPPSPIPTSAMVLTILRATLMHHPVAVIMLQPWSSSHQASVKLLIDCPCQPWLELYVHSGFATVFCSAFALPALIHLLRMHLWYRHNSDFLYFYMWWEPMGEWCGFWGGRYNGFCDECTGSVGCLRGMRMLRTRWVCGDERVIQLFVFFGFMNFLRIF